MDRRVGKRELGRGGGRLVQTGENTATNTRIEDEEEELFSTHVLYQRLGTYA